MKYITLQAAATQVVESTSVDSSKSPSMAKPNKAKQYLARQKDKWTRLYQMIHHKIGSNQVDSMKKELTRLENSLVQVKRLAGILNKLKLYTDTDRQVLKNVLEEITTAAAVALDVERSSIWFYNGDKTNITSYDLYQRKAREHSHGVELSSNSFPNYFQSLLEERSLPAHDANTVCINYRL